MKARFFLQAMCYISSCQERSFSGLQQKAALFQTTEDSIKKPLSFPQLKVSNSIDTKTEAFFPVFSSSKGIFYSPMRTEDSTRFNPNFYSHRYWIFLSLAGFVLKESIMNTEVSAEEATDIDDEILAAVMNGDINTLKEKVTPENYSSMRDKKGNTLLLKAIEYGHFDIIQWLLSSGIAKKDEKNNDDETLLILAAAYGYDKIVAWLLQEGYSNLDEKNKYGNAAISEASHEGYLKVIEVLLAHSKISNSVEKYISLRNKNGLTPLLEAAYACTAIWHDYDIFSRVELRNGDPRMAEKSKIYLNRDEENLFYLVRDTTGKIQNGIIKDTDSRQKKLSDPDFKEKVCDMVAKDGHIYQTDKKREEYRQIIETLLRNGANVEDKDDNGCTPLLHATINANLEGIELLLDYGADINASDKRGVTALHYAVARNDPELVELLIKRGADIEAKVEKVGREPETPMDIIERNLYENYKGHSHVTLVPMNFIEMENKIREGKDLTNSELDALKKQRRIGDLLREKWKEINQKKAMKLEKLESQIVRQKEQDISSVVETFRKILSEKINVELYTDRAIYERVVKPEAGSLDTFLEIAQLVSNSSGDMATRVAVSLSCLYVKGKLEESRVQESSYIQLFERKSISEITREAAKMVAERYKEQLWLLSAEGLDEFGQYFCAKLLGELRRKYKSKIKLSQRGPVPLVRELYEIMIDPSKGEALSLPLRGKDQRELNRDKAESWNSQELMNEVGVVVKREVLLVQLEAESISLDMRFKKIRDWMISHPIGSVLFLKIDKKWYGYFIYGKENEKKYEEVLVDQSKFSKLLECLESVQFPLSEDNKRHLQDILKKENIFIQDDLDQFYVLKEKSKKYGICYGDKEDVMNTKYHCRGWFWGHPCVVSELKKYDGDAHIPRNMKIGR